MILAALVVASVFGCWLASRFLRMDRSESSNNNDTRKDPDTMHTTNNLLLVILFAVTLAACGSSPLDLPACPATVVSETCVDHPEVAMCLDDKAAKVVGCIVPSGVDQGTECVAACPPNHYENGGAK